MGFKIKIKARANPRSDMNYIKYFGLALSCFYNLVQPPLDIILPPVRMNPDTSLFMYMAEGRN